MIKYQNLLLIIFYSSLTLSNPSTNGFQFSSNSKITSGLSSTRASKCEGIFKLSIQDHIRTNNNQYLKIVLESWRARGDYTPESFNYLWNIEQKLNPHRITWLNYEGQNNTHAIMRVFDGTNYDKNDKEINNKDIMNNLLPVEVKSEGILVREFEFQPIVELGLVDVSFEIQYGLDSLLHRATALLKERYYLKMLTNGVYDRQFDPKILVTGRSANAVLFSSKKYGFTPLEKDGVIVKTKDGMTVLETNLSFLINNFYGKRLYPKNRYEEDYWKSYWLFYKSQLQDFKKNLYLLINQLNELQYGIGGYILLSSSNKLLHSVNTNILRESVLFILRQAEEALNNENLVDYSKLILEIKSKLWDFTPEIAYYSTIENRVGSGLFKITTQLKIERWDIRKNLIQYVNPYQFN